MSTLGRANNPTDEINDKISSINSLIEAQSELIEENQVNINEIEGNVDILIGSVDTSKIQVGSDIEPKTDIFGLLSNIENAESIIPEYSYASVYYPLLDKNFEVLTDGSAEFCNIKINNDDNKNLNNVLKVLLKEIEILKQNQKLDRTMISQAGFGLGTTRITSMPGTNITFNTRDINAFVDTSSIPTFQTPDNDGTTPLFSEDYVQERAIEIADYIYDILPFDIGSIIGMTKFEFLDTVFKAEDPIDFLSSQLLARVQIGITGDLFVKEYSPLKGLGEFSANFLNVNEICENALKLINKDINIHDVKNNDVITYDTVSGRNLIFLRYNVLHFQKDTVNFKLELKYPITGIIAAQLRKVNGILSLHPDVDPTNIIASAILAGGLSGFASAFGTSLLVVLLNNMIGSNESLIKYIKTIPPIVKINDSLFFNKNNNNFTINIENEIELHKKYTELIDWKLKDNNYNNEYNIKIYIIGSIGRGSIDRIGNKNINNAVEFSSKLLLISKPNGINLTIDFFSSRSFLQLYIPTISYEADEFIDQTSLSISFWTKTNSEQRTRRSGFLPFFNNSKEIIFHIN